MVSQDLISSATELTLTHCNIGNVECAVMYIRNLLNLEIFIYLFSQFKTKTKTLFQTGDNLGRTSVSAMRSKSPSVNLLLHYCP